MTEEIKKVDESTSKSTEKTGEETFYSNENLTPEQEALNERATKVGLESGATEEEIIAKEKEASDLAEVEAKATELKERATKVGLKEDATEEEVAAKEKEVKPKEKVVPEKYEIKIDDKCMITDEQLGKIESFAKDRGFSNEEAQAMVDQVNATIDSSLTLYQEEQVKQVKELVEVTWPKEAKEDTEIGGDNFESNCELSKRVVQKFGSEKFLEILEKDGYGNHPEFLRFTVKLGKAMSDDSLIFRGSTDIKKEKSLADTFYGDT